MQQRAKNKLIKRIKKVAVSDVTDAIKNGKTISLDELDQSDPIITNEPKTYSKEEREKMRYAYAKEYGVDPDSIEIDEYGRAKNVILVKD